MQDVIVWSGWVGGLAVGTYMVAQLLITGKALGASTGFGNVCALASKHPFFRRGAYADRSSWRLWFTLGIPIGGFVALISSGGSFAPHLDMGAMYAQVLPEAWWARGLVLTVGGFLIGFGARLAGGCTSGHSIVGLSLLNAPSYVASIGFFLGGIAIVQALFYFVG
ncbi:MAG: YeeE/YedE family protein [Myxococcales bacterium]|nr:YeeE/YedE family protein [Myxococcales bacterium]